MPNEEEVIRHIDEVKETVNSIRATLEPEHIATYMDLLYRLNSAIALVKAKIKDPNIWRKQKN